jgi:raffinose/stachyose/melibiose transport system substrate-binding protein
MVHLRTKLVAATVGLLLCCAGILSAEKVTLKIPLFGDTDTSYYLKVNDLVAAYKAVAPDITIELETFRTTEEYENTMKVRFAAGEYPDIFQLKPYTMVKYADQLMDLAGQPAVAACKYPDAGKVNGKIIGVPRSLYNEFVYYNKSLFAKAGVKEVPQTWDEFLAVCKKLKAAGITPIMIGGKDVWPTYPFTEYMPALQSGNGSYWNLMATQEEPFKAGSAINIAYTKFQSLVNAGAFDAKTSLGLTHDQAKMQFAAKKGAMLAAGMWFYGDFIGNIKGDVKDLGCFFLPVRDKVGDPLNATAQYDGMLGVPKGSKHPKEALAFFNWLVTSEYNTGFINYQKSLPTGKGIKVEEKFFDQAADAIQGGAINFITYDGGNAEYQKISSAVQFDCKRTGQEILAGYDLNKTFAELNAKWKSAKAKK